MKVENNSNNGILPSKKSRKKDTNNQMVMANKEETNRKTEVYETNKPQNKSQEYEIIEHYFYKLARLISI